MNEVYKDLLKALNESEMSKQGIYLKLTNTKEIAESYSELNHTDFKLRFKYEYSHELDDLKGIDFITIETDTSNQSNLFKDVETAYIDVMEYMKSDKEYKKFIK